MVPVLSSFYAHTDARIHGKNSTEIRARNGESVSRKKKKKRGQPLLINFLVAKIFPSSRIHEPSSVWVPPSFFTQGNSHRDEKFTRSCDRRMERVLLLFLFFFFFSFVKMLGKGKRKGGGGISTSRQIKMNPKITRSSTAYVRITNESPECEYLSTISSEPWVLFLVLIILYG